MSENAFFGELSLLDGGPHTATARTLTETTLLTIGQGAFYNFLDKHPQFSRTLLTVLVDRLRTSTMNMRDHLIGDHLPRAQPAIFRQFVDKAARFVSSSRFLFFAILFMVAWMVFQSWLFFRHHNSISFADNPPEFSFLQFIVTLTSFLLTILVLTSQRGLAEHDRIPFHRDTYHVLYVALYIFNLSSCEFHVAEDILRTPCEDIGRRLDHEIFGHLIFTSTLSMLPLRSTTIM